MVDLRPCMMAHCRGDRSSPLSTSQSLVYSHQQNKKKVAAMDPMYGLFFDKGDAILNISSGFYVFTQL
jgi:hypothetical protein